MPKKPRPPRKRRTLTHASILALRYDPRGYPEHSDAGCAGLRVAVFKSGHKSFILRYQRPGSGRAAKMALGEFDAEGVEQRGEPRVGGLLTLAAARTLAADLRREIKLGRDPGQARKLELAGVKTSREQDFEWAVRSFILDYSKPKNRRWRDTSRMLGLIVTEDDGVAAELKKGSIVQRWRDRPVTDITRQDLLAVLAEPARRGAPFAANGLQACLRKLWNWLISEHDVKMVNPLAGMAPRAHAEARDRVLTPDEIRAFWRACDSLGRHQGRVPQLLLVTGQRRDEIARLTYLELAADRSALTLAKVRTKNGNAHVVPLSALARRLIPEPRAERQRYVFTTNGRTPVSGFSKLKWRLDALMLAELRKITGDPETELAPWRFHDLRRTLSTGMAELGVRQEVTESVLNHRTGKVSGVAAVYNRYEYDAEKRQALDAWAARLLALITGNVVPLRREAAE